MTRARLIRTPGEAAGPAPGEAGADDGSPRFYIVHGLPVSTGAVRGCPYACAEWANGSPGPFSLHSVQSSGKEVSEQQFRDLVSAGVRGW